MAGSTRCRFTCESVTTKKAWRGSNQKYLYEAEFTAVHDGSPECEAFYEATPTGSLKIGMYKPNVFEPGKDYYLDISEARE